MRHSVLALAVGIIVAIFMVGCSGGDSFTNTTGDDGLVNTAYVVKDIDLCPVINVNADCEEVIEVALLTTDTFDATTVTAATVVVFAGAQPVERIAEDWDGDGDIDMVFSFNVADLALTPDQDTVTMSGQNGVWFTASATIELVDDPLCEDPCDEVEVDFHPGSNPNPINVKSDGVTPAAILTSATFDATQVDPATVRLLGVAPIRWAFEDVLVSPEYPDGPPAPPDGDIDLSLKFDTQELVATGLLTKDTVTLTLTGETFSGMSFTCTDTVKILGLKK